MLKVINISIDVAVDENISGEELAGLVANAFESHPMKANAIGKLRISSPVRDDDPSELREPGWKNSIWDKASC